MLRFMMKSKIHKATVTESNLHYVGSITIDEALMEAVDIYPNEKVQVVNNCNGARFETYVITGERNSGVICLNGAAARMVQKGDEVIIIAYSMVEDAFAKEMTPRVIVLNKENQIEQVLHREMHATSI